MRSQKPISISIGPFNKVRIESLIAVSVMYKTNHLTIFENGMILLQPESEV